MLDIKPHKEMLNRFREEEPTSLAGTRLIVDPGEEILVKEIEEKEGRKREAINNRGYYGVAERDYNQLSHRRKEGSPDRRSGRVLDCVHGAGG